MKSKISIFALSFATVCMVSSCLGDNDTEYTYYDDTAITGITLGTLNIYGYKKASDGVTNSLYKKGTVTGGSLTIDQYNRTITNASDSLPVGTDLTKVLFSSITTLNNGIVGIKSLTSDTVSSFSTSDSLDFSKPRDLYVYSSSGQYFRKYTVTIVAHKEYADTFKWSKFDVDNDIKNYKSVKAGIHSNNLIVLGETDNGKELKVSSRCMWTRTLCYVR